MDKSTKKILDTLGNISYTNSTQYRFHKRYEDDKRYNDGRCVAYDYIADLIFYYQRKEKHLLNEFEQSIIAKKKDLSILKDNNYKKGILDTLDEVIQELHNIKGIKKDKDISYKYVDNI